MLLITFMMLDISMVHFKNFLITLARNCRVFIHISVWVEIPMAVWNSTPIKLFKKANWMSGRKHTQNLNLLAMIPVLSRQSLTHMYTLQSPECSPNIPWVKPLFPLGLIFPPMWEIDRGSFVCSGFVSLHSLVK